MTDASPQPDRILVCPQCLTHYEAGSAIHCAEDGALLKRLVVEARPSLIGRTIDGRWVIDREIGAGGMGTVYRAKQLNIDRHVAIKTMRRGLDKGSEFLERFLREATLASQVTHPHLVSIHDFGQMRSGELFLVMEYLDGESLAERMQREPLTLDQALQIASQLCAALAAAHGVGIIHRDLKPENVFLLHMPGRDVFVKLLDFGIAKHMNSQAMTQTGQVFGTPDYMSPEQCRGQSNIDHRSDLYALGCILYEMASGITPFCAESMIHVLFRHITDPPPSLVALHQDASLKAVEGLLARLLQKNPSKRYVTALKARDAIEQVRQQLLEPCLLLPAWRSEQPQVESDASTKPLSAGAQEELEAMMVRALREPEPLDAVRPTDGLSEELSSPPEPAEETAELSPLSATRPRVELLLIPLIVLVAGVLVFAAVARDRFKEATPAPVTSPALAPDVRSIPSGGDSSRQALESSTIEIARLRLDRALPLASRFAREEALAQQTEEEEEEEISRARSLSAAARHKKNRDKSKASEARAERTPASAKARIESASARARSCLGFRLKKAPGLYEPWVGKDFVIAVSLTIDAAGAPRDLEVEARSPAPADSALIGCIERPFKRLTFAPTSEAAESRRVYKTELTFSVSQR